MKNLKRGLLLLTPSIALLYACDDGPRDPNIACKNLEPEIIELMKENDVQVSAFFNHKYMTDENGKMVIPDQDVVPGKITINCQADVQLSNGTTIPFAFYKSLDGLDLYTGYEPLEVSVGYDCTSLRPDIIALSEENRATAGFALVQIYEPQTLSSKEDRLECQGRAMWSDSDETVLNYTAYIDIEDNIIITYEIPQ